MTPTTEQFLDAGDPQMSEKWWYTTELEWWEQQIVIECTGYLTLCYLERRVNENFFDLI
jgi:hypothetical protein